MAQGDGDSRKTSETLLNIIAFAVFSFVGYTLFHIVIAAAEDILAGTALPTFVVYLCAVGPYFIGTLLLPIFTDKISPLLATSVTFFLEASGIILVAFLQIREAKLIGICLISAARSFTDVGFLSLTALYEEVTARAFTAGSGIEMAFAVIYYTGMTTWFCVPVNTTLSLIAWLSLLLPLFYSLMDKKSNETSVSHTTSYEDIPYSPLTPSSQEQQQNLTNTDKVQVIWENVPLSISMFNAMFGKYLLMQAIVTSLVFSNAPFHPRDHYQYYIFAVVAGELLGRSYGLVMFFLKCSLPDYTKQTWIFASIIVTCLLFLVFASWFHFLHNVWIVIFICFVVGLNTGVLYNCTFAAAASERSSRHKMFSRAFLVFPIAAGMFTASLLGLYIEPLIKDHCVTFLKTPRTV